MFHQKPTTKQMHFCSFSKSRKLHGVDHNGLSIEPPEYGIVNYNDWINSVSRYLSLPFFYIHSYNSLNVCAQTKYERRKNEQHEERLMRICEWI